MAVATTVVLAGNLELISESFVVSGSSSGRTSVVAESYVGSRFSRTPAEVVSGSSRTTAQEPTTRRSVWDGVYTDEQAKRGETQYARNCESCHGPDLSGNQVDEIPGLVWDAFLTQWNERTLKDLYESVNRSMPRDKPKSLNARAYIDVIAYVLQANKFPSGTKELGLNPTALGEIVIERDKK
jgi:cytochrome c553